MNKVRSKLSENGIDVAVVRNQNKRSNMRFLKFILTAGAERRRLTASASPADPKNGVEYKTLAAPQPVDTGKKVESSSSSTTPARTAPLSTDADAWVKKQGDNIVFKRMHISRPGTDLPQQKMFFTLEAMGLLTPELHTKAFNEIHVNRNRLNRDEQVFDFIAKQGVDKQKFIDTYRGFGVAGRVRKSIAMMDAYNVDSWPRSPSTASTSPRPPWPTPAHAARTKPMRRVRAGAGRPGRQGQGRRSKHDAFARLHHRRLQRHRRRTGRQYAAQGATLGLLAGAANRSPP
jgi:thiol:disulfide interchange protein DsbA